MGRILFVFSLACALAGESPRSEIVSSAFGHGITVSERDLGGTLMLTLSNGMPSAVRQYEIDVWALYEHGPARRLCVLKGTEAGISPSATVQLPGLCRLQGDAAQGRVVSHTTKILAIELENGWTWHAPTTYKLTH